MKRTVTPKTVLLVEDEADIVVTLSKRLESWGLRVVSVATGRDGLAALEAVRADVILLDLLLPGMSGIEVLEELHSRVVAPPVIVLTALPLRDARDAVRLGARGVLQKPVEPSVLRQELDRVLGPHLGSATPPSR
ncbi:MAG: response regulator [Planctomycetes bacterium]|nr:response regulator [Planctomycetota bacterium]MBI3847953.1 response regulator [Planctomycetota bacterium]